ncbi:epoxide hydrolase family protein [Agromyces sp. LHK192]|uniref:epoxide hydrolase family protein n=1 Tax=Agromyces sp. LHK192 TaxID=2498704 RepID=UPI000FDAC143|nr:epoxide hydrolase [Agromyces sp. LHK192]
MHTTPFRIDVPAEVLDDLAARLRNTRWPNEAGDGVPGTGPTLPSVRALAEYWLDGYDWPAEQAALNAVPHLMAEVGGATLHVVHAPSEDADAVPILLLHGWADSFVRYRHLIAPLTDASADVPFHVVVPSLPGFDFSSQPPAGELRAAQIAQQLGELMSGLGYERFMVHGGDWGSVVAQEVARAFPERVIGMHLTDLPFIDLFMVDRAEVDDEERAYLEAVDAWGEKDGYYIPVQSHRPLTLSYALSDSPVGLAAWLRDHFERLATSPISDDDFLTNVMTYWVAGTIRSSMRLYSEGTEWDEEGSEWDAGSDADAAWSTDAAPADAAPTDAAWSDAAPSTDAAAEGAWGAGSDDAGGWSLKIDVPTAMQIFPDDIASAPRVFCDRFFDVQRYTVEAEGGHFAALEVPEAVVADLRTFAASLREPSDSALAVG